MDFRICGLPFEPFAPIFEMSENELSDHGSVRRVAPPSSIYPCRVSLRHALPGETVILTNYVHLPDKSSPYRSLGPIFVRRDPGQTFDRVNEVPPILPTRQLSLACWQAMRSRRCMCTRPRMAATSAGSRGREFPVGGLQRAALAGDDRE